MKTLVAVLIGIGIIFAVLYEAADKDRVVHRRLVNDSYQSGCFFEAIVAAQYMPENKRLEYLDTVSDRCIKNGKRFEDWLYNKGQSDQRFQDHLNNESQK